MTQARNVMKSLRVKDFLQMDGKILGNGLMPLSKDKIWYVWEKKDSGNTGSGHSWDDAFLTMGEALSAAGDNDYIFVGPGSYDEGETLTITQDYLTIVGTNSNNNSHEAYIYGSSATEHLMVIKADKVRIFNLGFVQTKAKSAILFGDTDGQAFYQALIQGCKFDLYGTGTYAIRSGAVAGDSTAPDAPDVTIRDCLFRSFATAAIQMNWTRAQVYNNTIICDAGTIGIEYIPTTGNRPDSIIANNYILGVGSTDTGIKITNSPTAGLVKVIDNSIANCATSITTAKADDEDFLYNHVSNATGGEIFDPSP